MTLVLNQSVAVAVIGYTFGDPVLEPLHGDLVAPVTGVLPGVRIDVQRQCVDAAPALAAYLVEPAAPIHDPGPNGVRLYSLTLAELQAAAPVTGSPWDVFVEAVPRTDV